MHPSNDNPRTRAGLLRMPKIGAVATTGIAAVLTLAVIAPRADATRAVPDELVVRHATSPMAAQAASASERAQGMVFADLGSSPGCAPGLAIGGLSGVCTHGPDAAPAGIDVTRPRSTEDLVAATDQGTEPSSSSTAAVPCYGDGASGKRVQVVYAHASDVPDRFSSLAPSLVGWAANVDGVFNDSAAETGGVRHVRWVTTPGCELVVQRVELSTAGDDSFSNTINELRSVGLQRADRKYLVWVDATRYCGIATLNRDDRADQSNASNVGTGYARIDSGCWGLGRSTEAHELMHMLGGVQYTAPHTTGGGHCTDDYDRMCYADASGVAMTYPCASSHDWLFDCNHDDYFSTNPPVGSYLATHWNTASSSFLESVEPSTVSPGPSPITTSSPIASPSPSPSSPPSTTSTSTDVFSGRFSRKASSLSYDLSSDAGTLHASLSFTKAKELTLTLVDAGGAVLATQRGASGMGFSAAVQAGAYRLVVSGSTSASFKLTVTYPAA